jgi:hypothetical protein
MESFHTLQNYKSLHCHWWCETRLNPSFRINGSGNHFTDNLDMIMDYQCLVTNYFKNNLLE